MTARGCPPERDGEGGGVGEGDGVSFGGYLRKARDESWCREIRRVDDAIGRNPYIVNSHRFRVWVEHHHPSAVTAEIDRIGVFGQIGGIDPVSKSRPSDLNATLKPPSPLVNSASPAPLKNPPASPDRIGASIPVCGELLICVEN